MTRQINTENILGFSIANSDWRTCVDQICAWIESKGMGRYFVCGNPHSFVITVRDPEFAQAIRGADLITPDGFGIVLASRILDGRIRNRITGSGVFRELSHVLNKIGGYRYFLLGSTESNLELIRKKFSREYPNIEIVGTYSPPFNPEFSLEDNEKMVDAVNRARPHVLWVGMSAPKQEKWIYKHKDQLEVNFIGAVGAVFDFYVGTIKRSHPWFLAHGLEWLPRLIQEPWRLWDRTLISAPKFILRVLKQRWADKDDKVKLPIQFN